MSDLINKVLAFGVFVGCAALAVPASATTYHMSPHGSDGQSGRSASSAWRTFDHAVDRLRAGDTLVLENGQYTNGRNGRLRAFCGHNARNGQPGARITVRAAHQRRAWLKGNGRQQPVQLIECKYWDLTGLRVSGADVRGGNTTVVHTPRSSHLRLRKLLVHDANGHTNSSAIGMTKAHHILVEDTEVYRFHRHGISAYQSDHITIRRSYVNGRGARDLGGHGSHNCCKYGGDEGYSFYFTSNSTIENSISVDSEGLSSISGLKTVLGNPGGQNNQVLGSISYHDLHPYFTQSRRFYDRPYAGPSKNILYKDMVVVGGADNGPMTISGTKSFRLKNGTFIGGHQYPFNALTATRHINDDRDFLGCSDVGGCNYRIENVVYKNNRYNRGDLLRAPNDGALNFRVLNSNAWSARDRDRGFSVGENVGDSAGRYRHSQQVKPTHIGLGKGQCAVFVPEDSNMKGAGRNGADMGANVLYRYQNRHLTDKPLWDTDTGQFPCGARIPGSPNDVAGDSCYDVHKQLNVNTNGCQLPYDGSGPTRPENTGGNNGGNNGGHTSYDQHFKVVGHGPRLRWKFQVNGRLAAEQLDDHDTIDGGRSFGHVTTGTDHITYAGHLTKLNVEQGDAKVYIKGKLVAGGSANRRHKLVIEGYGTGTKHYRIRVGGGLDGEGLSGEDNIHYNEANGAVGGGADVYRFNGDLDILEIRGDARVYLDGTLLRGEGGSSHNTSRTSGGNHQNQKFKVIGHGPKLNWQFRVNGRLRPVILDDHDTIQGGGSHGHVTTGRDVIEYDGDLTEMNVEQGDAQVFVRGKMVAGAPGTSRHKLVIEGYGGGTKHYRIRVGGGLTGDRLNGGDHIRYNEATGAVQGGTDIYRFKGDLDILEIHGHARVYMDGHLLRGTTDVRNQGLQAYDGSQSDTSMDGAACSATPDAIPPVPGGAALLVGILAGCAGLARRRRRR